MQLVLVVGADASTAAERRAALEGAGFSVQPVATFLDARQVLAEVAPQAIVTDVYLGDYNGLHLVAIAQVEHPRTTCLVVGPRDPALQAESYHLGARYLVEPVSAERMTAVLAELVANPRPQRRWPRKRPAHDLATVVSGVEARIIDVSYGGAGIEFLSADIPNDGLELIVPSTGQPVPVERVWARRPGKAQPVACGLALRRDSAVDARWRSFVDSLELLPEILPLTGPPGRPA